MKCTNITHQEGAFNVTSENALVSVNLPNRHPELVMEDGSMLIFDSISTYYAIIGSTLVSDTTDGSKDINMEALFEMEYISDTVSGVSYNGADITSITSIKFEPGYIFLVKRDQVGQEA